MAEAADSVVILSAARTPLGRFMGELSPLAAHKLGSHVINAALDHAAHRLGQIAIHPVERFAECAARAKVPIRRPWSSTRSSTASPNLSPRRIP